MNIVVKTANHDTAPELSYDALLAEVMRLCKDNRRLRRDKQLLLDMLAEAIGEEVIVVREDNLGRPHRFHVNENLGGEILVRIV